VPGEPADRADIRPNDLILAIDNVPLDDSVSLTERLFDFEPGDEITLTILRGSGQDEVTLVLSERPAGP
ncbi:MAG: PDZ domain-containing protein, partial [Chloroflexota bacterium]|nr:PDZ domain-containing protein [Chloroflexota bacterium]